MKIFIECFVIVVVVLAVIFTPLFSLAYYMSKIECKEKAEKQELVYDFGFFQGCMIKQPNGKWIDYDKYRIMENEE